MRSSVPWSSLKPCGQRLRACRPWMSFRLAPGVPFSGQVELASLTGIDARPFGPVADPLVRGSRQPCHFGHGLFQPLIQGPETLPRGFVFEVQRCSDCGLAKTPCSACARGARARVARWFPAIQFCAFRFCFSFFICARRRPQCSAPPGLRSGPPGLGHPPSPLSRAPPRLLINPTQKYLRPKDPEGPRTCYCFAR